MKEIHKKISPEYFEKILFGEKTINAKSIMNLMASCIKMDSEIEIRCEGAR